MIVSVLLWTAYLLAALLCSYGILRCPALSGQFGATLLSGAGLWLLYHLLAWLPTALGLFLACLLLVGLFFLVTAQPPTQGGG